MSGPRGRPSARRLAPAIGALLAALAAVPPASAHGGGLGAAARSSLTIPTWLVVLTGGAAVGASFLLASFVTDYALIRAIDGWRARLPDPGRVAVLLGRLVGLGGLGVVLLVGVIDPGPGTNLAVLLVWVGWWAGYTGSVYLVGNTWPVLNPWRTLAGLLPSLDRAYPERLGAWPAVVALLALVWVEVASPVASDAALLATLVAAYTLLTLAGAAVLGAEAWFAHVDPVARVFRAYGRVAPVAREGGRLRLRLPGAGLTGEAGGAADVAFVVALLWVTTFDGLVATPAWRRFAGLAVGAGLPPAVLYPLGLVAGLVAFLGVYRGAARWARRTAGTYRSAEALAVVFAPSLLAIAAGYHLAHYLGYFLTLAPALATAATRPLVGLTSAPTLALPPWFEFVGMAAVLAGHLLAIWVAHARAYELFPGRRQAVRSQYPLVGVMVFYTLTSLWIIAQPEVPVPYT